MWLFGRTALTTRIVDARTDLVIGATRISFRTGLPSLWNRHDYLTYSESLLTLNLVSFLIPKGAPNEDPSAFPSP